MPRISADKRAVAAVAVAAARTYAPRGLTRDAKQLWHEILASKPADWFAPGSLILLQQYCELAVHQQNLIQQLTAMHLENPERFEEQMNVILQQTELEKRVHRYAATLSMLATKLRLSVQANIDRRSGQMDEAGEGLDPLLGGAISLTAERRKRARG